MAIRIETITLIVRTKILTLSGHWEVEEITNKDVYSSDSLQCYDYLLSINNTNYIPHHEDTSLFAKLIEEVEVGKEVRFDVRGVGADRKIILVRGAGKLHQSGPDGIGLSERVGPGRNLLEAVFNTSTLGLHVLKSVRNDAGSIIDFDIILTNETSDKIAGRKVSGLRMLEGWPHTKEIGLFDKFVQAVDTGAKVEYEHLYEGDGVRAWFQWIASRLNDGLYVTIEDITLRKNAEEALKLTANRLQSIFDGVPAIIALLEVVLDSQGQAVDFVISAANKAASELSSDKTSDIIGKRMTDLYPEAFRGQLQENYLKVFNTGEPLYTEFLFPGLERWFSIFVTKQVDGHGLVVAAIEITAQKKGEEQRKQNQILSELNEAKTEFFSNVSHEFRTPLTLMLAPIQDLLKKVDANPAYTEDKPMLQMVYRNALRLEKLVNTLLNFSRIEAGRSDAIFKPINLAEFTTLLAGNFRSIIEHAGLKFSVDCETTEPIYVNQDMWEKIVLNLLSNAFKFTFEGKIELKLKSYKKHVKLQVKDTGIGISPTNHSRIFERFTRLPNVRTRSLEGSGIGLSLVNELVKIHGGNIEVSSREGSGSIFTVSIPKGKDHLPLKNIHELKDGGSMSTLAPVFANEIMSWMPDAQSDKVGEDSGALTLQQRVSRRKQATILLVDDNSDVREYIRSILSQHYIVATADNGKRALELVSAGLQPDLVLADLMMPEMDGFTLLKKIREYEGISDTPFIMLSARASEEDRVEGLRVGVDDYLVKPFSRVSLLATVNSRIQRSHRRATAT